MKKTVQFQGKTLTQEEAAAKLKALSIEGLKKRFGATAPETEARLDDELGRIGQMEELLQRFVILWDLARYAKERQILVGPVSGSLSSSLTAYCLGITSVDPLQYGLLFEWFLAKTDRLLDTPVLGLPARGVGELSAYLAETYAGEQAAELIYEDCVLSRMDLALQMIAETSGERLDLEAIDLRDEQVFSFLVADEEQRFHLGGNRFLPLDLFQPHSIEELAAAVSCQMECPFGFETTSLIQPYDSYLKRAERPDPMADIPPFLRSITGSTRGCILYKEQAALLLRELTGCSLEQAMRQVRQLGLRSRPKDSDPAQLMVVIDQRPYFLDLEHGVPLPVSPDGQCPNTGDGDPVPLLAGLCWRIASKCLCISSAIRIYWAAYLQCHYPEASQKACEAVPEPEFFRCGF